MMATKASTRLISIVSKPIKVLVGVVVIVAVVVKFRSKNFLIKKQSMPRNFRP